MTNREKYAEQILDVVFAGTHFGFSKTKNRVDDCYEIDCEDCIFFDGFINSCKEKKKKWANAEYVKKSECFSVVKEEQKSRWIPCSERLPDKQEDVLVTVKYNGFMGMYGTLIKTGYLDDFDWDGDCIGVKVVAWMPLPEPYREVSDSENIEARR